MGKRGPKPTDPAILAARGTLRPDRQRKREAAAPTKRVRKPKPAKPRDYVGQAVQYAHDVLSGRIVACAWVKLAIERQDRDLQRAATDPAFPYVWSDEEAVKACAFVERCPHVEGRWASPLIRLEGWQAWLVTSLFGWRHRSDLSRRRFTLLYLEVARKAAKSTLAAAIGLYHLTSEGELGASVICGATTGLQARMVFGVMQKMVRRSVYLGGSLEQGGLGLVAYANAIVCGDGSARPVNSKATTLDGLNPSCIILDEAHAQDFGLHDVLKSAQGARRNPLMICPTTAGYDLLSVGYALRSQLTKILQRVFEADHFLGIIYTLDDADDWRDPRVWIKANPMLGISPTRAFVENYAKDAQQAKELEGEFRVKVCNIWSASASAWLSMSSWDLCADPKLRLEDFVGQPCWIGADLAQIDDLAAVGFVFQQADNLVAFVRCYLPEGVVAERARAIPAYRTWVDDKLLITTEGTMIDYNRIEADIKADCLRFRVQRLVFDQFGSLQIAASLASAGLPAEVEPKNARTMTAPSRELEVRVKHRRLRHDGNSLLKWAASNCVVQRRTDDSLLPKKDSAESANKIDPIDALLSAIGAMLRGQAVKPKEYQLLVLGGAR